MPDPADKTLAMVQASCPQDAWPFVEAFLAEPELNIARAEKAVGWPAGAGARCLADPRVRNVIGQILQDTRARQGHIRDRAILTLAQIAFYDPADAWDEKGLGMLSLKDMPLDLRMAVTEYTETVKANGDKVTRVKFTDRVKVLDMVLKMFGALEEDTEGKLESLPQITFRGVQGVQVIDVKDKA